MSVCRLVVGVKRRRSVLYSARRQSFTTISKAKSSPWLLGYPDPLHAAISAAGMGHGLGEGTVLSTNRRHQEYDVIVVGGGHAGCEAANAAARCGARTLLVTHKLETIGEMSCNPSIGGVGKGTLVREIDALGGVMGRVIDHAGIKFNMLNFSKGPAVHGPRAQADRVLYRYFMQRELQSIPNLDIASGGVEDLVVKTALGAPHRVEGVILGCGTHVRGRNTVITTGTFLRGVMHIGPTARIVGGRHGDGAAHSLSVTMEKLGLRMDRLTTATPPRLDGTTISVNKLTTQSSDE